MRPNRVLGMIAVVLFIIALLVTLVVRSGQQSFDADSPEYAVQQFLSAVVERDSDSAAEFLSSDNTCTSNDIDRAYTPEDVKVDLLSVEENGNDAKVKVSISMGSEGPFGSMYSEAHTYRLIRSEKWLISGTPWPLYECGVYKP